MDKTGYFECEISLWTQNTHVFISFVIAFLQSVNSILPVLSARLEFSRFGIKLAMILNSAQFQFGIANQILQWQILVKKLIVQIKSNSLLHVTFTLLSRFWSKVTPISLIVHDWNNANKPLLDRSMKKPSKIAISELIFNRYIFSSVLFILRNKTSS